MSGDQLHNDSQVKLKKYVLQSWWKQVSDVVKGGYKLLVILHNKNNFGNTDSNAKGSRLKYILYIIACCRFNNNFTQSLRVFLC